MAEPLKPEECNLIAESLRGYRDLLKKLSEHDMLPGPMMFDLRPMLKDGFERLARRVEEQV